MPFKVDFNKEIHIFKDPFASLLQLQQFVVATFKKLPQYFGFWYIDQDGDSICVSSDQDLQVLQESSKSQKIFVKEISQEAWMLEQEGYQVVEVQKEVEIPVKIKEEPVQKIIEQVPVKVKDDTKVPINKDTWACTACTYLNKEYLFFCDMCNTMKQVQVELIQKKPEVVEKKQEVVENKSKVEEKKQEVVDIKKEESQKKEEEKKKKIADKIALKQAMALKKEELKAQRQAKKKECAKVVGDKIKKLVQQEVENSLQMIAEKVKAMIEQQQPQDKKPEVQQSEVDYLSALLNVQQPQQPKVVHHGYICDGCEGPIIGVRYECGICRNFDYCEKCEATIDHIHPFLKIKSLCQAVMIDFVSEKDLNLIQVSKEKSQCQVSEVQKPVVVQQPATSQPQGIETIGKEEKKDRKGNKSPSSKYPKEVRDRAKQVKKILGGRMRDYCELCQVYTDIQSAINSFLGGDKLNQPKVVDPEVLKKAGIISEILGGKPEEYYEVIDLFKGKTLEVMIEHILQQKEHQYYKQK